MGPHLAVGPHLTAGAPPVLPWQALDRWGATRAETNWVIVAVAALRLRAILGHFSPRSTLFFAQSPPEEQRAAREGVWKESSTVTVSWPVGKKLMLDDEAAHEAPVTA